MANVLNRVRSKTSTANLWMNMKCDYKAGYI